MKCPKCKDSDLEKTRKGDVLICRDCGHTENPMSKADLIEKVKKLEEKVEALTGKTKGGKADGEGDQDEPWI